MKFLTDFCVSQPIPLLGMTTEDKYVFNTHIYSSRDFLFYLLYSCFMKVLNFRSNILTGKFPVSSLFLRHRCIHVQLMCPCSIASVPLASIPSTALIFLLNAIEAVSVQKISPDDGGSSIAKGIFLF